MKTPFGPPIDLSGLSGFALTDARPRRSVFIGRVSTKDQQNPASSIPRQVVLASERLEPDEEFVAYFWDVESGMLPPELRGQGPQEMYDKLGVPTPRDGGLQDLVDRVEQLAVTHVLAERSDRLARAMLTSLTVEHELSQHGVEVVYANEPVGGTESGRLRVRRFGQVEAELYKKSLMEMSTGGQFQHAISGWNHGFPPYPYIAVVDENAPVRAGGRFGTERPKRKLVPHPDSRRFDMAREAHRLRREERLRTGAILARLSAEPDRYPGSFSYNFMEGLLANPKLSGHQVYNRKAPRTRRKGQPLWNPISEWVWSPEIAHERVVSLEEWKQAQEVTDELREEAEGSWTRVRRAASALGLSLTAVDSSGTHTVYEVGGRRITLPTPIPDELVQLIIDDMERGA
ncbi:recombinase family protein [Streptomyces sp. NPDC087440]|uniref:recombinase family protein n=1 Tax=Streptomyces sp. NPDC087440 TaxID=3365790 RepID=UPI00381149A7